MRQQFIKTRLLFRALLVAFLLAAQCAAVAHEVTHPVYDDGEPCTVCSVGGHGDAAVPCTQTGLFDTPFNAAPGRVENLVSPAGPTRTERARAPPVSL